MGNLSEISLPEAVNRSRTLVAVYLKEKQEKAARGELGPLDHFPCWFCVKYLDKSSWLKNFPNHPWAGEEESSAGRFYANA